MDPVKAFGILTSSTGLTSEAVRKACHLDRKGLLWKRHAAVISAKGDFSGANQSGACTFNRVYVAFSSTGIETNTLKDLLLGHIRCNHWSETMAYDYVHSIVFKGHLQKYGLVLEIVELGTAHSCSGVKIYQVQFLAKLDMVQRLEIEHGWLSNVLDGGVVLVFLSNRRLWMGVVWNLLEKRGVALFDLLQLRLHSGDPFFDGSAFVYELLARIRLHLALHLHGVLVSGSPKQLCIVHEDGPLVLKGYDFIDINLHVAVLDVCRNFITSGL